MVTFAITGGSGFVGSRLADYLGQMGHNVAILERRGNMAVPQGSIVVHVAGLAHRIGKNVPTSSELNEANVELTKRAADAARSSGAARFVFVSSIAVIAGNSGTLQPDMPIAPLTDYGRSKADAEASLMDYPEINPLIIRPPLVYGPNAKGNTRALTALAMSPIPSPFGATRNGRSLVSVLNLVSAIEFLALRKSPHQRIYHVADAHPVSLSEMITWIREGAGRRPRQINIPPSLLRLALVVLGRRQMAEQLTGDLLVDAGSLFAEGWEPPQTPRDGFIEIGRYHALGGDADALTLKERP